MKNSQRSPPRSDYNKNSKDPIKNGGRKKTLFRRRQMTNWHIRKSAHHQLLSTKPKSTQPQDIISYQ